MTIDSNKIPAGMGCTVLKLLCELRSAELKGEARSLSALAKKFGLSTAAMTGAQDSAAKAGWLTSRHSAADRRQKILELSHAGVELVESLRPGARLLAEGKEAA